MVKTVVRMHSFRVTVTLSRDLARVIDHFQLVLYANNDMHPAMLCTTEPGLCSGTPFVQEMCIREGAVTTLVSRLFGSYQTDGVWAQELIGSACVSSNHKPTRIIDINSNAVAHIEVDQFPFSTSSDDPAAATAAVALPFNKESHSMIVDVQKAQMRQKDFCSSTDNFATVQVFLDTVQTLPIAWFAFHATRMCGAAPDSATAYFQRLLDVSEQMQLPGSSAEQQLADMLSLPSLAWVYRDDKDSRGNDSEYWASLWSNPTGTLHAFDCEDGAKALLELFHVFKQLTPSREGSSKKLRRLHRLAQKYRPFLAIGELFSDNGKDSTGKSHTGGFKHRKPSDFVMHCYVMLLPPRGGVERAITLDAASYSSSAWDTGATSQLDAPPDLHPVQVDSPLACIRSSPSELLQTRAYGALLALLTSEIDNETAHYLMNRIDTFDFLLDALRSLPTPCYSVTYKETERIFARELALCPDVRFPEPCSLDEPISLSPSLTLSPSMPSSSRRIKLSKHDELSVFDH